MFKSEFLDVILKKPYPNVTAREFPTLFIVVIFWLREKSKNTCQIFLRNLSNGFFFQEGNQFTSIGIRRYILLIHEQWPGFMVSWLATRQGKTHNVTRCAMNVWAGERGGDAVPPPRFAEVFKVLLCQCY